MITTAVIAFREFLEAFLIVGVFLGISRKLNLKKETEIWFAAAIGVILSLLLSTIVYLFGDRAKNIFTETNSELLESYLMIFSGLFIAYVVFSLHSVIRKGRGTALITAHQKIQKNIFDLSLFLTIVFLVLREGLEIALFTASVSLFSAFMQNFIGLLAGFAAATALGTLTLMAYIKFPIGKIFKATEYMIILLGASLTQHGITELLEEYVHIDLSHILSFNLHFLPNTDTLIGHLIQGFFGIDQGFSFPRLMIMFLYIEIVYFLFFRKKKLEFINEHIK